MERSGGGFFVVVVVVVYLQCEDFPVEFLLKEKLELTRRCDKWSPVCMLTSFKALERHNHVLQSLLWA